MINLFIGATTSTFVDSLTLPNQVTPKPRHTKFSSSTPTTDAGSGSLATPTSSTASKDSGVAFYRYINSNSQSTCILMKTDAVVEVSFDINSHLYFSHLIFIFSVENIHIFILTDGKKA